MQGPYDSRGKKVNEVKRYYVIGSHSRIWNGYSPYNPGNVTKVLDIMRTVHNYVLPGKDVKTPVERLGLAQAR